ncbi:hypothetical protein PC117_g15896 [Phytophthora cactorum]|uniref:Uncharacterized protein n=1 Tax=Phytophthora cactorum TaxID=29920 RepID=A0A8T1CGA1_9STRA|nr:hypothetical protein PC117_g15896 [Phytophthora cactorum]
MLPEYVVNGIKADAKVILHDSGPRFGCPDITTIAKIYNCSGQSVLNVLTGKPRPGRRTKYSPKEVADAVHDLPADLSGREKARHLGIPETSFRRLQPKLETLMAKATEVHSLRADRASRDELLLRLQDDAVQEACFAFYALSDVTFCHSLINLHQAKKPVRVITDRQWTNCNQVRENVNTIFASAGSANLTAVSWIRNDEFLVQTKSPPAYQAQALFELIFENSVKTNPDVDLTPTKGSNHGSEPTIPEFDSQDTDGWINTMDTQSSVYTQDTQDELHVMTPDGMNTSNGTQDSLDSNDLHVVTPDGMDDMEDVEAALEVAVNMSTHVTDVESDLPVATC